MCQRLPVAHGWCLHTLNPFVLLKSVKTNTVFVYPCSCYLSLSTREYRLLIGMYPNWRTLTARKHRKSDIPANSATILNLSQGRFNKLLHSTLFFKIYRSSMSIFPIAFVKHHFKSSITWSIPSRDTYRLIARGDNWSRIGIMRR